MDSLSQIALGAAVADLTLGARIGRRAILVGAVLGTLPDLDVLVPYADAIDSFTRHRSFSHSLLVLSFISLPIAVLARRLVPVPDGSSVSLGRWWLACWAVLVTHPLLDGFTIYGTQLFWPIPVPPVAIGSIFIIDPLYTLPLLVGLVVAWRHRGWVNRAHLCGLALSSLWLLATLVFQQVALEQTRRSLASAGVEAERLIAVPLPFGVLWRTLALDGDDVLESWTSLLDDDDAFRFERVPLGLAELGAGRELPAVRRMEWFTGGYVAARMHGEELILTDLRIGTSRQPIFSFSVATREDTRDSAYAPHVAVAEDPVFDFSVLRQIPRRAIDPDVYLDTATPEGVLPRGED